MQTSLQPLSLNDQRHHQLIIPELSTPLRVPLPPLLRPHTYRSASYFISHPSFLTSIRSAILIRYLRLVADIPPFAYTCSLRKQFSEEARKGIGETCTYLSRRPRFRSAKTFNFPGDWGHSLEGSS